MESYHSPTLTSQTHPYSFHFYSHVFLQSLMSRRVNSTTIVIASNKRSFFEFKLKEHTYKKLSKKAKKTKIKRARYTANWYLVTSVQESATTAVASGGRDNAGSHNRVRPLVIFFSPAVSCRPTRFGAPVGAHPGRRRDPPIPVEAARSVPVSPRASPPAPGTAELSLMATSTRGVRRPDGSDPPSAWHTLDSRAADNWSRTTNIFRQDLDRRYNLACRLISATRTCCTVTRSTDATDDVYDELNHVFINFQR